MALTREKNRMGTPRNEPPARAADRPAPAGTGTPPPPVVPPAPAAPVPPPEVPAVLEPGETEIAEWAEQERKRREAWLSGPTTEERAAWAQRERERRMADLRAQSAIGASAPKRSGTYYLREAQLAAEGAAHLVWKEVTAEGPVGAFRKWSQRSLDALVRAGREWEEDVAQPGPRRAVTMDEPSP
jgi:hypothetical protein